MEFLDETHIKGTKDVECEEKGESEGLDVEFVDETDIKGTQDGGTVAYERSPIKKKAVKKTVGRKKKKKSAVQEGDELLEDFFDHIYDFEDDKIKEKVEDGSTEDGDEDSADSVEEGKLKRERKGEGKLDESGAVESGAEGVEEEVESEESSDSESSYSGEEDVCADTVDFSSCSSGEGEDGGSVKSHRERLKDFIEKHGNKKKGRLIKQHVFQEKDVFNPEFKLGTIFTSKELFRTAVHSHALRTHKSLSIKLNDQRRMHVKCLGGRGRMQVQG